MRTFEEVCERVAGGGDFPGGVTNLGLKKTEVLVLTLESLVDLATIVHIKSVPAHRLANFRELIESTRSTLEADTYRVFLDLRKPQHSEHPLRLLWNQWKLCKEKFDARFI